MVIKISDWKHLTECPSAKFTWKQSSELECYDESYKGENYIYGKNLTVINQALIFGSTFFLKPWFVYHSN